MKRIYIAGPMRGIPLYNFPAFDNAARLLRDYGDTVVSPAELDRDVKFDPTGLPDDHDWNSFPSALCMADVIGRDLESLLACDTVYMLDGWENSKGAKAEKAVAEWQGLSVLYQTRPPREPTGAEQGEDILLTALRITSGDRNATYGPPDQDFRRTAAMWSALKGVPFSPRDVAMFMICIKLSRETHQRKTDNWVDVAGYARCGSMCGD